jgi:hypothetical protein
MGSNRRRGTREREHRTRAGTTTIGLFSLAGAFVVSSCSPAGPRAAEPTQSEPRVPASPSPMPSVVPFKRVDHWRYVDLSVSPTSVEVQLRRHLEQEFPHARFSSEYTCLARERASFRERHAAVPEESLEWEMFGRCRAPTSGAWRSTYLPAGRVLDRPLSRALLTEASNNLTRELQPFTVFGVTARYVGKDAVVFLQVASPEASIHVGMADPAGTVRVEGTLLADFDSVDAVINQDEYGTERCALAPKVSLPRYSFTCRMAPADAEAWLVLTASKGPGGWETPIAHVPAHKPDWKPPALYHQVRSRLPAGHDVASGIAMLINEARTKLGRRPLTFAREQSLAIQPIYQQMFRINATGNWTDDTQLRAEALRGAAVTGGVRWARIVTGIAFDGDASDWLPYRLRDPLWREALMNPDVDQLAVATYLDPTVGFGAAAIVYSVFTPEREQTLGDAIAARIGEIRGKRGTRRLESPELLTSAALDVARGHDTPENAFTAALQRINRNAKSGHHMDGVLLTHSAALRDLESSAAVLDPNMLEYGIVVTHHTYPEDVWARPIIFVWFRTQKLGR